MPGLRIDAEIIDPGSGELLVPRRYSDHDFVAFLGHDMIMSYSADEIGYLFVSPLSGPLRAALHEYRRRSLRVGDFSLFPADKDPSKPIHTDVAQRWLPKAERLAGQPGIKRGIFHRYRRLWATERKHVRDVDVAAAGGWKDERALKQSYQQADPETVLRVVENGA